MRKLIPILITMGIVLVTVAIVARVGSLNSLVYGKGD
jgi:hypothetical protein